MMTMRCIYLCVRHVENEAMRRTEHVSQSFRRVGVPAPLDERINREIGGCEESSDGFRRGERGAYFGQITNHFLEPVQTRIGFDNLELRDK